MKDVISILKKQLRNQRIYKVEAMIALEHSNNPLYSLKEMDAFEESKKNCERLIPQLEVAIALLEQWKDKL